VDCVFIHPKGTKNAKVLLSLEKKLSYGMSRVKTYENDRFWKKHLQDFVIGNKKSHATFFH
jgi:hypothetical protein